MIFVAAAVCISSSSFYLMARCVGVSGIVWFAMHFYRLPKSGVVVGDDDDDDDGDGVCVCVER